MRGIFPFHRNFFRKIVVPGYFRNHDWWEKSTHFTFYGKKATLSRITKIPLLYHPDTRALITMSLVTSQWFPVHVTTLIVCVNFSVWDCIDHIVRKASRTKMDAKMIDKLPESILLDIFHWCAFKDLGHVAMVCKKWRRIAYDHSLWRDADLRGLNLTERTLVLIDRISSFVFTINISGCAVTVSFITAIAEKCINLKTLR